MAQEIIDFGAFPDDPTADAIRTAFQKTQNNFAEIYASQLASGVASVNRNPGAGLTVNQPTGNVVLTANIACVQVATSTLSIGRDSNGGQFATITQSSQRLIIDLPQSLSTQNINANGNLSVLGNVSFSSNLTVAGNLNITGNMSLANISSNNITANTITGSLATNAQPNITSVGNLSSLNVVGNIVSSNFVGKFSNGNSNIDIPASNGIIEVSVSGTQNVASFSNTGLIVNSNLQSNNANLGNLATANFISGTIVSSSQPNITNLGTLDNLNVANNSNLGNLATANFISGTIVSSSQPNITTVGTLTNLLYKQILFSEMQQLQISFLGMEDF